MPKCAKALLVLDMSALCPFASARCFNEVLKQVRIAGDSCLHRFSLNYTHLDNVSSLNKWLGFIVVSLYMICELNLNAHTVK